MRILLVEDNRELASWLGKALRQAHYAVDIVHDGEDAELSLKVAFYAAVAQMINKTKRDIVSIACKA